MKNWDEVKYFVEEEFADPSHAGSGQMINTITVLLLDRLRKNTGWAILTHYKVGGCVDADGTWGHSENSHHLLKNCCTAVDFHFCYPATMKPITVNPRLQYFEVEKMRFGGLGVYFDQKWRGMPLSIAFHVDTRPFSAMQRWRRNKDGSYVHLLEN